MGTSPQSQPAAQLHKGLLIAIIATLAVGSAFVLVGIFIIVRACLRPRRRTRPKPSLPILADPYADDQSFDIKEKDSPVFGGKERFSSQNGIWTLAIYPLTDTLPTPAQAAGMTRKLDDDNPLYDHNALSSHSQWPQLSNAIHRSQLPSSHPMHSQTVPMLVLPKAAPPYQAVRRFFTARYHCTLSRLSMPKISA